MKSNPERKNIKIRKENKQIYEILTLKKSNNINTQLERNRLLVAHTLLRHSLENMS